MRWKWQALGAVRQEEVADARWAGEGGKKLPGTHHPSQAWPDAAAATNLLRSGGSTFGQECGEGRKSIPFLGGVACAWCFLHLSSVLSFRPLDVDPTCNDLNTASRASRRLVFIRHSRRGKRDRKSGRDDTPTPACVNTFYPPAKHTRDAPLFTRLDTETRNESRTRDDAS